MTAVICVIGMAILSWALSSVSHNGNSGVSGVIALGYFGTMLLIAMGMAFYQQWLDRKNHSDD